MNEESKSKAKQKIYEYYIDAPIKRWAASFAGISEDTLSNWEKEDSDFADHLKLLKAGYLRKKLGKVKSEWVLERMFNEDFNIKSIEPENLEGLVIVTDKDCTRNHTDTFNAEKSV